MRGLLLISQPGYLIGQFSNVRIVLPNLSNRGIGVGDELARMSAVKISHRGGHHHDIPRRKEIDQHYLSLFL